MVVIEIMIRGTEEILLARQSINWLTTEGYISQSKVNTSQDSDGGTVYKPVVKFSYEARRRKLSSNQVYFGGTRMSTSDRSYSRKIVEKYPKGKTVTVFYHPRKPKQAVLEAGITKRSFILFTFGFMFFDVGSCIALLYWLYQ